MSSNLLKVEGISKSYDGNVIFKNIDFSIGSGEILGLFGKSGAGKSTIGRCIIGLEKPDLGKVLFHNKNIFSMDRSSYILMRPKLQMIFQHPETSLDPRMKTYDSILEPLIVQKKVCKSDYESEARRLADLVGLREEHLCRYPGQLSGGEIQRIVLARILSLEPEVIVADEPTSMLDVSVQAQVLRLMEKIRQEKNISFLLISHDIDMLNKTCNRIAFMDNGTISRIQ